MMDILCFTRDSLIQVNFILPVRQTERVKDRVREEDTLLLLFGFRDYHKDSELTLIQQDCHSS